MATQAKHKSTPTVKHDAIIEEQLSKARLRVRLLDVSIAVVGSVLLVLIFGLSMALADRWASGLSATARQLALGTFLLAMLGYLGFFLVWPLLRSVNPYYAALRVEETLPAAKNSVVNWLDLHGEPLPPAFRAAVAARAAKDLAKADIDTAFSPRRLIILGLVTAVVFIAFAINLALGGSEFLGRLSNVFFPFGLMKNGTHTRTHLDLVEPKGGDVVVSVGRAVGFSVNVTGYVPKTNRPESVRLQYRYHQNDPYESIPMERDGAGSTLWVTQMPAFQVHSGFWYRIAGGDAATAEHRVQTRATPLISDVVATYHFRPYLAWPDFTVRDANLEAPRGTEVTLLVRTNRTVREGRVEYQTEKGTATIAGKPVGNDDPTALRVSFTIEASGSYRIWFTSTEGEGNTDPLSNKVKAIHDAPPRVEVLKPLDTKLPLNGVLRIEGRAEDDFGVTGMTLRMQVSDDNQILPKPFRDGKKDRFKLADGSYPQTLEYQDFVEIDKLRDSQGQPMKPGVIFYWLEATDACDYPGPNVGKSPMYKVFLSKPDPKKDTPRKAEDNKKQAEKDQKQFEQRQDEKNKEESKAAAEREKERKAAADKSKEDAKAEKGPGDDKKPDQSREPSPEDKQNDATADKVNQALDNKDNQGTGKGDGQPKDPGEAKGEGANQGDKKNEGEAKPQPNNGGKNGGEGKGEGKKGADQPKGEGKGAGQPNPDNNADNKQTGEGKGEGKQGGDQQKNEGEGKGEGKKGADQQKNEGEGKGEGKKGADQQKNEGTGKGEGKPQPGGDKGEKGAARGGPDDKGGAKPGPGQPTPPAEAKGGGNNEGKPDSEKAEGKGGGKAGNPNTAGQEKPAPAGQADLFGEGKGEGKHPGGNDAKHPGASKPVKDLIDRLDKGTPKQREEAKELLEQIRRNAKDKVDRDAAASALREAEDRGQKAEEKTTQGAPRGKGAESQKNLDQIEAASRQIKELADKLRGDDKREAKRAEEELEKLSRDARAEVDRKGAAAAIKEFAEKPPEGQPNDPSKQKGPTGTGNNTETPEKGDPTAKGKDKGTSPGGKKPSKGTGNDVGVGSESILARPTSGGTSSMAGSQADIDHQRRSGELQLKRFKEQVTPKMLKELGISEAEWKKFLATRAEKLKAMKSEPAPAGRGTGSFLPNGAPRAFETTGKASDPLQSGSRSLPPPELMEGFKRFGDTSGKDKR